MENRSEKIQALKDLQAGKINVAQLLPNCTTMVIRHSDPDNTIYLLNSIEVSKERFDRYTRLKGGNNTVMINSDWNKEKQQFI